MTALTLLAPAEVRLAALRMQANEVLNEKCNACGHRLAEHSRVTKPVCKQWSHKPPCKCRGYVDG